MNEVSRRSESAVVCYEIPKEQPQVLLTGDRPTGPLHLGHYYGSLTNRVKFQEDHQQYILIADVQAFTDNADNPSKVSENVIEVALDYLAVGIDPTKSTIYIQSAIPETAELTLYLMNLINVGKLSRNPTVKQEIKLRGFGEEVPVGFFTYPINQAADISQFCATIIPVGIDQIPMIELTNNLVRRFNQIYKLNSQDVLVECRALVADGALLPGTDGSTKMSKSLGNAIYLKDTADQVVKKVKKMYTDPNHLRVEDPGQVEGNPVFTYLKAFSPDLEKVEQLSAHYQRGGLGDGVVKQELATVLNDLLEPIRAKRSELDRNRDYVWQTLREGTEQAREVVAETLGRVRRAMGISYFE